MTFYNPQTECKLLSSKNYVTVDRDLATTIGLYEAIIIQQLHHWLKYNEIEKKSHTHFREDRWWAYNSFEKWQKKDFPFLSINTIKRTFSKLGADGIILSSNFNEDSRDRTNWYSIDYLKLNEVIAKGVIDASTQNAPMDDINNLDGHLNNSVILEEPEGQGYMGQNHVDNTKQCPPGNPVPIPSTQLGSMQEPNQGLCNDPTRVYVYKYTEKNLQKKTTERETKENPLPQDLVSFEEEVMEESLKIYEASKEKIALMLKCCKDYHKADWPRKARKWLLDEVDRGRLAFKKASSSIKQPVIDTSIDGWWRLYDLAN